MIHRLLSMLISRILRLVVADSTNTTVTWEKLSSPIVIEKIPLKGMKINDSFQLHSGFIRKVEVSIPWRFWRSTSRLIIRITNCLAVVTPYEGADEIDLPDTTSENNILKQIFTPPPNDQPLLASIKYYALDMFLKVLRRLQIEVLNTHISYEQSSSPTVFKMGVLLEEFSISPSSYQPFFTHSTSNTGLDSPLPTENSPASSTVEDLNSILQSALQVKNISIYLEAHSEKLLSLSDLSSGGSRYRHMMNSYFLKSQHNPYNILSPATFDTMCYIKRAQKQNLFLMKSPRVEKLEISFSATPLGLSISPAQISCLLALFLLSTKRMAAVYPGSDAASAYQSATGSLYHDAQSDTQSFYSLDQYSSALGSIYSDKSPRSPSRASVPKSSFWKKIGKKVESAAKGGAGFVFNMLSRTSQTFSSSSDTSEQQKWPIYGIVSVHSSFEMISLSVREDNSANSKKIPLIFQIQEISTSLYLALGRPALSEGIATTETGGNLFDGLKRSHWRVLFAKNSIRVGSFLCSMADCVSVTCHSQENSGVEESLFCCHHSSHQSAGLEWKSKEESDVVSNYNTEDETEVGGNEMTLQFFDARTDYDTDEDVFLDADENNEKETLLADASDSNDKIEESEKDQAQDTTSLDSGDLASSLISYLEELGGLSWDWQSSLREGLHAAIKADSKKQSVLDNRRSGALETVIDIVRPKASVETMLSDFDSSYLPKDKIEYGALISPIKMNITPSKASFLISQLHLYISSWSSMSQDYRETTPAHTPTVESKQESEDEGGKKSLTSTIDDFLVYLNYHSFSATILGGEIDIYLISSVLESSVQYVKRHGDIPLLVSSPTKMEKKGSKKATCYSVLRLYCAGYVWSLLPAIDSSSTTQLLALSPICPAFNMDLLCHSFSVNYSILSTATHCLNQYYNHSHISIQETQPAIWQTLIHPISFLSSVLMSIEITPSPTISTWASISAGTLFIVSDICDMSNRFMTMAAAELALCNSLWKLAHVKADASLQRKVHLFEWSEIVEVIAKMQNNQLSDSEDVYTLADSQSKTKLETEKSFDSPVLSSAGSFYDDVYFEPIDEFESEKRLDLKAALQETAEGAVAKKNDIKFNICIDMACSRILFVMQRVDHGKVDNVQIQTEYSFRACTQIDAFRTAFQSSFILSTEEGFIPMALPQRLIDESGYNLHEKGTETSNEMIGSNVVDCSGILPSDEIHIRFFVGMHNISIHSAYVLLSESIYKRKQWEYMESGAKEEGLSLFSSDFLKEKSFYINENIASPRVPELPPWVIYAKEETILLQTFHPAGRSNALQRFMSDKKLVTAADGKGVANPMTGFYKYHGKSNILSQCDLIQPSKRLVLENEEQMLNDYCTKRGVTRKSCIRHIGNTNLLVKGIKDRPLFQISCLPSVRDSNINKKFYTWFSPPLDERGYAEARWLYPMAVCFSSNVTLTSDESLEKSSGSDSEEYFTSFETFEKTQKKEFIVCSILHVDRMSVTINPEDIRRLMVLQTSIQAAAGNMSKASRDISSFYNAITKYIRINEVYPYNIHEDRSPTLYTASEFKAAGTRASQKHTPSRRTNVSTQQPIEEEGDEDMKTTFAADLIREETRIISQIMKSLKLIQMNTTFNIVSIQLNVSVITEPIQSFPAPHVKVPQDTKDAYNIIHRRRQYLEPSEISYNKIQMEYRNLVVDKLLLQTCKYPSETPYLCTFLSNLKLLLQITNSTDLPLHRPLNVVPDSLYNYSQMMNKTLSFYFVVNSISSFYQNAGPYACLGAKQSSAHVSPFPTSPTDLDASWVEIMRMGDDTTINMNAIHIEWKACGQLINGSNEASLPDVCRWNEGSFNFRIRGPHIRLPYFDMPLLIWVFGKNTLHSFLSTSSSYMSISLPPYDNRLAIPSTTTLDFDLPEYVPPASMKYSRLSLDLISSLLPLTVIEINSMSLQIMIQERSPLNLRLSISSVKFLIALPNDIKLSSLLSPHIESQVDQDTEESSWNRQEIAKGRVACGIAGLKVDIWSGSMTNKDSRSNFIFLSRFQTHAQLKLYENVTDSEYFSRVSFISCMDIPSTKKTKSALTVHITPMIVRQLVSFAIGVKKGSRRLFEALCGFEAGYFSDDSGNAAEQIRALSMQLTKAMPNPPAFVRFAYVQADPICFISVTPPPIGMTRANINKLNDGASVVSLVFERMFISLSATGSASKVLKIDEINMETATPSLFISMDDENHAEDENHSPIVIIPPTPCTTTQSATSSVPGKFNSIMGNPSMRYNYVIAPIHGHEWGDINLMNTFAGDRNKASRVGSSFIWDILKILGHAKSDLKVRSSTSNLKLLHDYSNSPTDDTTIIPRTEEPRNALAASDGISEATIENRMNLGKMFLDAYGCSKESVISSHKDSYLDFSNPTGTHVPLKLSKLEDVVFDENKKNGLADKAEQHLMCLKFSQLHGDAHSAGSNVPHYNFYVRIPDIHVVLPLLSIKKLLVQSATYQYETYNRNGSYEWPVECTKEGRIIAAVCFGERKFTKVNLSLSYSSDKLIRPNSIVHHAPVLDNVSVYSSSLPSTSRSEATMDEEIIGVEWLSAIKERLSKPLKLQIHFELKNFEFIVPSSATLFSSCSISPESVFTAAGKSYKANYESQKNLLNKLSNKNTSRHISIITVHMSQISSRFTYSSKRHLDAISSQNIVLGDDIERETIPISLHAETPPPHSPDFPPSPGVRPLNNVDGILPNNPIEQLFAIITSANPMFNIHLSYINVYNGTIALSSPIVPLPLYKSQITSNNLSSMSSANDSKSLISFALCSAANVANSNPWIKRLRIINIPTCNTYTSNALHHINQQAMKALHMLRSGLYDRKKFPSITNISPYDLILEESSAIESSDTEDDEEIPQAEISAESKKDSVTPKIHLRNSSMLTKSTSLNLGSSNKMKEDYLIKNILPKYSVGGSFDGKKDSDIIWGSHQKILSSLYSQQKVLPLGISSIEDVIATDVSMTSILNHSVCGEMNVNISSASSILNSSTLEEVVDSTTPEELLFNIMDQNNSVTGSMHISLDIFINSLPISLQAKDLSSFLRIVSHCEGLQSGVEIFKSISQTGTQLNEENIINSDDDLADETICMPDESQENQISLKRKRILIYQYIVNSIPLVSSLLSFKCTYLIKDSISITVLHGVLCEPCLRLQLGSMQIDICFGVIREEIFDSRGDAAGTNLGGMLNDIAPLYLCDQDLTAILRHYMRPSISLSIQGVVVSVREVDCNCPYYCEMWNQPKVYKKHHMPHMVQPFSFKILGSYNGEIDIEMEGIRTILSPDTVSVFSHLLCELQHELSKNISPLSKHNFNSSSEFSLHYHRQSHLKYSLPLMKIHRANYANNNVSTNLDEDEEHQNTLFSIDNMLYNSISMETHPNLNQKPIVEIDAVKKSSIIELEIPQHPVISNMRQLRTCIPSFDLEVLLVANHSADSLYVSLDSLPYSPNASPVSGGIPRNQSQSGLNKKRYFRASTPSSPNTNQAGNSTMQHFLSLFSCSMLAPGEFAIFSTDDYTKNRLLIELEGIPSSRIDVPLKNVQILSDICSQHEEQNRIINYNQGVISKEKGIGKTSLGSDLIAPTITGTKKIFSTLDSICISKSRIGNCIIINICSSLSLISTLDQPINTHISTRQVDNELKGTIVTNEIVPLPLATANDCMSLAVKQMKKESLYTNYTICRSSMMQQLLLNSDILAKNRTNIVPSHLTYQEGYPKKIDVLTTQFALENRSFVTGVNISYDDSGAGLVRFFSPVVLQNALPRKLHVKAYQQTLGMRTCVSVGSGEESSLSRLSWKQPIFVSFILEGDDEISFGQLSTHRSTSRHMSHTGGGVQQNPSTFAKAMDSSAKNIFSDDDIHWSTPTEIVLPQSIIRKTLTTVADGYFAGANSEQDANEGVDETISSPSHARVTKRSLYIDDSVEAYDSDNIEALSSGDNDAYDLSDYNGLEFSMTAYISIPSYKDSKDSSLEFTESIDKVVSRENILKKDNMVKVCVDITFKDGQLSILVYSPWWILNFTSYDLAVLSNLAHADRDDSDSVVRLPKSQCYSQKGSEFSRRKTHQILDSFADNLNDVIYGSSKKDKDSPINQLTCSEVIMTSTIKSNFYVRHGNSTSISIEVLMPEKSKLSMWSPSKYQSVQFSDENNNIDILYYTISLGPQLNNAKAIIFLPKYLMINCTPFPLSIYTSNLNNELPFHDTDIRQSATVLPEENITTLDRGLMLPLTWKNIPEKLRLLQFRRQKSVDYIPLDISETTKKNLIRSYLSVELDGCWSTSMSVMNDLGRDVYLNSYLKIVSKLHEESSVEGEDSINGTGAPSSIFYSPFNQLQRSASSILHSWMQKKVEGLNEYDKDRVALSITSQESRIFAEMLHCRTIDDNGMKILLLSAPCDPDSPSPPSRPLPLLVKNSLPIPIWINVSLGERTDSHSGLWSSLSILGSSSTKTKTMPQNHIVIDPNTCSPFATPVQEGLQVSVGLFSHLSLLPKAVSPTSGDSSLGEITELLEKLELYPVEGPRRGSEHIIGEMGRDKRLLESGKDNKRDININDKRIDIIVRNGVTKSFSSKISFHFDASALPVQRRKEFASLALLPSGIVSFQVRVCVSIDAGSVVLSIDCLDSTPVTSSFSNTVQFSPLIRHLPVYQMCAPFVPTIGSLLWSCQFMKKRIAPQQDRDETSQSIFTGSNVFQGKHIASLVDVPAKINQERKFLSSLLIKLKLERITLDILNEKRRPTGQNNPLFVIQLSDLFVRFSEDNVLPTKLTLVEDRTHCRMKTESLTNMTMPLREANDSTSIQSMRRVRISLMNISILGQEGKGNRSRPVLLKVLERENKSSLSGRDIGGVNINTSNDTPALDIWLDYIVPLQVKKLEKEQMQKDKNAAESKQQLPFSFNKSLLPYVLEMSQRYSIYAPYQVISLISGHINCRREYASLLACRCILSVSRLVVSAPPIAISIDMENLSKPVMNLIETMKTNVSVLPLEDKMDAQLVQNIKGKRYYIPMETEMYGIQEYLKRNEDRESGPRREQWEKRDNYKAIERRFEARIPKYIYVDSLWIQKLMLIISIQKIVKVVIVEKAVFDCTPFQISSQLLSIDDLKNSMLAHYSSQIHRLILQVFLSIDVIGTPISKLKRAWKFLFNFGSSNS